jgi:hypothetical protein
VDPGGRKLFWQSENWYDEAPLADFDADVPSPEQLGRLTGKSLSAGKIVPTGRTVLVPPSE